MESGGDFSGILAFVSYKALGERCDSRDTVILDWSRKVRCGSFPECDKWVHNLRSSFSRLYSSAIMPDALVARHSVWPMYL